ncbi:restriction endonuclease subunit S [Selenomonas caprae]|uniref:Restriction endonuclease subunit S n=1 Tax=Selenomonas caprae TaxID=2606905 RepID=A0A5D6WI75_9FIRM|nr:restriction endonuclease subunit S [Selenomonas caprae]TYZ26789.1 restriction endonuclease subunit S [Selenomonas caprae]
MSDTISSIAQVIDSLHSTPQYQNTGYSMVRVVDINNEFLSLKRCSKVDEDTYVKHNKNHHPQRGDIIITRVGSYGMVGYVDTDEKFCLGQNLSIIHPQNFEDGKFLYYYILSPFMQKIIYGNIGGSAYKCLGLEDIRKLPLKVKGLKRREIGEFLYRIDKKINTNNSIIEVLESMAKTLYDYWFVQFDFPDANGRPYKTSGGKMVWNEELGREIPVGWETGQVSDLGDVVAGGTPSTEHPEYFILDGIAWITPKDMSLLDGKYIFHGATDISGEGLKNSSAKLMPAGSVVYTTRAPIGYVAVAGNDVCTNQGFKSVVPKEHIGTEFVYYTLKSLEEHFKNVGNGSTFSEVSKETFSTVPICIPPQEIIREFRTLVNKWSHMQKKTQLENRKLIDLRDFLLPMLMNGQVTFCS